MPADTPRRRPAWPLLATLGVHLLLAWSWRGAAPPAPAPDGAPERVFDLALVRPPAPERTQPVPKPPPAPGSRPVSRPSARPVPADLEREDTVPDALAAPPASPADPFAITLPSAPAQPAPGDLIGRVKRDALAIDRELRKGKSGVPETADTPMSRLGQALEAAYKDSSRTLSSETYTAPDGQVIYRFRQGGKVWCRTGGHVRPQIGGAVGGGATQFDTGGGGGAAGQIRCPSHGDWKRD